ncbi:SPX-domain-containing protein [Trichocladium antarcticum]|uniref:SPX-domain-containing protein n=1 Tax=Trichocladium antarcticum TaxID=1450529 RepID=A0AAN6ZFI8_9PEZI|nr:SPX-domain-containing protein [Trichocladium antarcticum]
MRFGKTLRQSIYAPWKDKYIDYAKLKSILREDAPDDEDVPWTEDDENRFCDEVFNTELEKVARFQEDTVADLRRRVDTAFETLTEAPATGEEDDKGEAKPVSDADAARLKALEAELDAITNEVKELQKYTNINYTGFLKIVKKHDRKRGDRYKIRPLMQVSLSKRPFNSEQAYAPLLSKLSLMYFAIRQQLEEPGADAFPADPSSQPETHNGEKYTAHKFWVHPDNLLEVKTYILRQLPTLVYSEQSAKEVDGQHDPTITSLYFDNAKFDLYAKKIAGETEASSLRLRWYGQLRDKPEIVLEHKLLHHNGHSEERRFAIKEKYIKPFLDGDYKMEKSVQKMERRGHSAEAIDAFRSTAEGIQRFIHENRFGPLVRANYVRTAFQNPGDDRVRISIDTDIAFIREDALDRDRPCRDPKEWHRADIDNSNMTYPFANINQSEVSRFPYAVLEIKLRGGDGRRSSWIQDLMGSHLVHPCPRFSKFVQGTASLFEDYVNRLPFWLSDLDTDIRKDPQVAFEEEEARRARRAENEQVVGSFLGAKLGSYKPSRSSPAAKCHLADRLALDAETPQSASLARRATLGAASDEAGEPSSAQQEPGQQHDAANYGGTASSIFPGFASLSKYSRAKLAAARSAAAAAAAPLPPGVNEPTEWLKNAGPLQIEPKVWLANERTFLKWQHICVLLGGLAVSLYAAGGGRGDRLAQAMGAVFVAVAVWVGGWSYWVLGRRRSMIVARSGRDFDFVAGPLVVAVALGAALVVNFVLAYRKAFAGDGGWNGDGGVMGANGSLAREMGELR